MGEVDGRVSSVQSMIDGAFTGGWNGEKDNVEKGRRIGTGVSENDVRCVGVCGRYRGRRCRYSVTELSLLSQLSVLLSINLMNTPRHPPAHPFNLKFWSCSLASCASRPRNRGRYTDWWSLMELINPSRRSGVVV